jgi:hypothetical protein
VDPCCAVCLSFEVVAVYIVEHWAWYAACGGIGSYVEGIGGAVAAVADCPLSYVSPTDMDPNTEVGSTYNRL